MSLPLWRPRHLTAETRVRLGTIARRASASASYPYPQGRPRPAALDLRPRGRREIEGRTHMNVASFLLPLAFVALLSAQARAGEVTALVTPKGLGVSGNLEGVSGTSTLHLWIKNAGDGATVFARVVLVNEGTPWSEAGGNFSYEVALNGGTLEFSLRLQQLFGVHDKADISVVVRDDLGIMIAAHSCRMSGYVREAAPWHVRSKQRR